MMYFFYCVMIILPIWQDSPLSGLMGSYGYSIVPVLSLTASVPFAVICIRKKLSYKGTFAYSWLQLLMFLVLVNIVANVLWLVFGGAYQLRSEDIVAKSVKGIVTAGSIAAYLMITTYMARQLREEAVVRPFVIAFAILAVVSIVEYSQLPNALPFAHYAGVFPYNRLRFLTIEASWTTLLIIVYGGMTIHYFTSVRRSRVCLAVTVVSVVFMVSTTTSKSLLVMVIIAVPTTMIILCKRDVRWILTLIFIILAVTANPFILDRLQELFVADIENYTSTATRTLTNGASLAYSIIFPFGTGNALYLHFFPEMLQCIAEYFSKLGISFNLTEINNYITSSDDFGMSAKSAILQYGLYWGIVGSVLFVRAIYRSCKSCWHDPRTSVALKITAVLSFISILAFMTFDSQYEFFSLMVVVDYYAMSYVSTSQGVHREISGDDGI